MRKEEQAARWVRNVLIDGIQQRVTYHLVGEKAPEFTVRYEGDRVIVKQDGDDRRMVLTVTYEERENQWAPILD